MTTKPPHSRPPSIRVTNLIRLECLKAQQDGAGECLNVLAVDDEAGILKLLHATLQGIGHELLDVARDGREAVDKALRRRPDLILMDINIPAVDGVDAARRIQSEYSCPIVFMSGQSVGKTLPRLREVSANGYLVKPFSADQLCSAIELALMQYRRMLSAEAEVALLRNELETSKAIDAAVERMRQHYGSEREQALEQLQAMARGRRCTLARAARETVEMLDELEGAR